MAVISFEQAIPVPTSVLAISANVNMTEGPSTANNPAVITVPPTAIQVDQATTFSFNWSLSGSLAPFVGGSWQFDVFYEQMGPAEATFPVPSKLVLNVPSGTFQSGTTSIVVNPNTVPEGVFRIVIRMMMAPTPSPICGFVDLGLVEYYKG